MQSRSGLQRQCIRVWLFVLLATVSAVTLSAADRIRPTAPTNLRTTFVTTDSVSLAWSASRDNSDSFSYIVSELNTQQSRTVPQTQTSFTWSGLQAARTYRFVVAARDAAGNQSANSNTLIVTTPSIPPPATPANLRVTATTVSSISLAWDSAAGATEYQVHVSGAVFSAGAQTSYVVTPLNPGSSYQFAVRAQNAGGASLWSAAIMASTQVDSTAPTVPSLSASGFSPGVAWLTWTESFDDAAGAVGYNVYVNGQPARSMLPVGSTPRTVKIYNLRAATLYEFSVKAYDESGNFSASSVPVRLTMPSGTDTIPPAAPRNLRSDALGNGISALSLAWDGSADNIGTMAYEVYANNALVTEVLYDVHYPGVDTFTTVRGLPPGTTQTFTVRARDEAGNVSALSSPITVNLLPTNDTTPPTPPVIQWGTTTPGCGFVDFVFGGSSDNADTLGQLEYEIYEDGLLRGVYRWEAFEASFGRHRFHIRALDRSGNRSAPSNEIVLDSRLAC